jgi:hypothetical protein
MRKMRCAALHDGRVCVIVSPLMIFNPWLTSTGWIPQPSRWPKSSTSACAALHDYYTNTAYAVNASQHTRDPRSYRNAEKVPCLKAPI